MMKPKTENDSLLPILNTLKTKSKRKLGKYIRITKAHTS